MKAVMRLALKALAVLLAVLAVINVLAQLPEVVAGRTSASSLLLFLVWVVIAIAFWWLSGRVGGASDSGTLDRMAAEAADYFQALMASREFAPPRPVRLLDDASEPLLAVCNARLLELRRHTTRVGVATRIKVGSMPFYIGRSDPMTRTELKEMSEGELGITPRRLLFSGPLRSADFDLARVAAVDVMADAISLSIAGRQNPVYLQVSNPLLWGHLVRVVKQARLDGRRLAEGQEIVLT